MEASESQTEPTTRPGKIVLQGLISLTVVVAIFLGVMPRIASYSDVWSTITAMTWLEITTLTVVGIWNLVTYWFVLVAALPNLTYPQAAVSNQASTAVSNTVPGGGALGVGVTYAMYSSWGISGEDTARSVVVSGVWNNFIKLGLPLVALALLAATGQVNATLMVASLVGVAVLIGAIVLFGLTLRSDKLAARVGAALGRAATAARKLIRKPAIAGLDEAAVRFRGRTAEFLQHRWRRLTVTSIVSHLSLYAVLLLALRHVGVSNSEVSWITVLAAFAFVRLISALPITPGGLGVVELGYAAALSIGMDTSTKAQIVAAVLVFRFITYFFPIPLGTLSYVFWQRNQSWRKEIPEISNTDNLDPGRLPA